MAAAPSLDWAGLFKWSMQYQDGTLPSPSDAARPLSEEDRKWLTEAIQHYSLDTVKRMQEIKRQLDGGGGDGDGAAASLSPAALLPLLDELEDLVADLDNARDLTLIGGLPTLLALLGRAPSSPSAAAAGDAAAVAAGAAAVLATAAASNPPVQAFYVEGGAVEALVGVVKDDGERPPSVRAKALLALSSLVRHCPAGAAAFLAAGGAAVLASSSSSSAASPALARRALRLTSYLAAAPPADVPSGTAAALLAAGALDGVVAGLGGEDRETRAAAADALAALAGAAGEAVKGDGRVAAALQEAERLRAKADDAGDVADEAAACADAAARLGL